MFHSPLSLVWIHSFWRFASALSSPFVLTFPALLLQHFSTFPHFSQPLLSCFTSSSFASTSLHISQPRLLFCLVLASFVTASPPLLQSLPISLDVSYFASLSPHSTHPVLFCLKSQQDSLFLSLISFSFASRFLRYTSTYSSHLLYPLLLSLNLSFFPSKFSPFIQTSPSLLFRSPFLSPSLPSSLFSSLFSSPQQPPRSDQPPLPYHFP